jgi:hypothetical protein
MNQLARLMRSENAEPFELSFDIVFEDEVAYPRVRIFTATRATATDTRPAKCGADGYRNII